MHSPGMLDVADIRQRLAEITYRPGWTLEVQQGAYLGQWLHIEGRVEDSYNPGTMIELRINAPLPVQTFHSVGEFDRWLLWRLQQVEVHEAMEWLHGPDGKPIFDPHRPHADRDRPIEEPVEVRP